jgi:hypothetical protein
MEDKPVRKPVRRHYCRLQVWMTDYFREQLERALGVLGIEVPEYM